jgi:hypothetical protein
MEIYERKTYQLDRQLPPSFYHPTRPNSRNSGVIRKHGLSTSRLVTSESQYEGNQQPMPLCLLDICPSPSLTTSQMTRAQFRDTGCSITACNAYSVQLLLQGRRELTLPALMDTFGVFFPFSLHTLQTFPSNVWWLVARRAIALPAG